MDEQEAIGRCQGGDQEAFGYLLETHQDKAYRIAYLIIGDHGAAEDVTQEAFLSAWRSMHTFKCGHAFAPWFHRIVVRCALKRLPKKAILVTSIEEPNSFDRPDSGPGPERLLRTKEVNDIVGKAVRRLSPQRKLIIILHYYLDQKTSEIADLLGVPEGTVKSEIFRAKKELSLMLQGVVGNEVERTY